MPNVLTLFTKLGSTPGLVIYTIFLIAALIFLYYKKIPLPLSLCPVSFFIVLSIRYLVVDLPCQLPSMLRVEHAIPLVFDMCIMMVILFVLKKASKKVSKVVVLVIFNALSFVLLVSMMKNFHVGRFLTLADFRLASSIAIISPWNYINSFIVTKGSVFYLGFILPWLIGNMFLLLPFCNSAIKWKKASIVIGLIVMLSSAIYVGKVAKKYRPSYLEIKTTSTKEALFRMGLFQSHYQIFNPTICYSKDISMVTDLMMEYQSEDEALGKLPQVVVYYINESFMMPKRLGSIRG